MQLLLFVLRCKMSSLWLLTIIDFWFFLSRKNSGPNPKVDELHVLEMVLGSVPKFPTDYILYIGS